MHVIGYHGKGGFSLSLSSIGYINNIVTIHGIYVVNNKLSACLISPSMKKVHNFIYHGISSSSLSRL